MSCISSNNNRFYAEVESAYGTVPAITEQNRIPTVRLAIRHKAVQGQRRDKTGSRTYVGSPAGVRTRTSFELETYMTSWQEQSQPPSQGALFKSAMGGAATMHPASTVASVPAVNHLTLTVTAK